jgi:hypothetical protein
MESNETLNFIFLFDVLLIGSLYPQHGTCSGCAHTILPLETGKVYSTITRKKLKIVVLQDEVGEGAGGGTKNF